MKLFFAIAFLAVDISVSFAQKSIAPFRNASLPVEARVADLLTTLTLEEKISLLGYQSKAIPRLGIPAYNWWNEALHGWPGPAMQLFFPRL